MAKSYWSRQWMDDWQWMSNYRWINIEGTMADYLPYKTPDHDGVFPNIPIESFSENIAASSNVVETDDGDEERISLSLPDFRVTLNLPKLKKDQLESLIDFYVDETKANGKLRSFKWTHPVDGCTYVVRFDSDLVDVVRHGLYSDELSVTLRVLGVETFSF